MGQLSAASVAFSSDVQGSTAGGGPLRPFPPMPPAVAGGGKPAGMSDPFLQITSDGNAGAGGRIPWASGPATT
jgi:hypothetical protein